MTCINCNPSGEMSDNDLAGECQVELVDLL